MNLPETKAGPAVRAFRAQLLKAAADTPVRAAKSRLPRAVPL
jgi:hypothetical protein